MFLDCQGTSAQTRHSTAPRYRLKRFAAEVAAVLVQTEPLLRMIVCDADKHVTVLADGVVGEHGDGFERRPGRAWMSMMKTWAADSEESIDMIGVIGKRIGFTVDGRIEVYVTEPDQTPGEKPHGYDIRFTPYDENA